MNEKDFKNDFINNVIKYLKDDTITDKKKIELFNYFYSKNIDLIKPYTPQQKTSILKNSLKKFKNTPFEAVNHFNNYDFITNKFYMIFKPREHFDYLKLKADGTLKHEIIKKFFKNQDEIKKLGFKQEIKIKYILNDFLYSDFVEIKNTDFIINKNDFVCLLCGLDLNVDDTITIYKETEKSDILYTYNGDTIALLKILNKYCF